MMNKQNKRRQGNTIVCKTVEFFCKVNTVDFTWYLMGANSTARTKRKVSGCLCFKNTRAVRRILRRCGVSWH